MDLNIVDFHIIASITGWLPRGAMDLNIRPFPSSGSSDRWLPRGAMDLNKDAPEYMDKYWVGSIVEPWI